MLSVLSFVLQIFTIPLYYASSDSTKAQKTADTQAVPQPRKARPRTKSPSHKLRTHPEESEQQVRRQYSPTFCSNAPHKENNHLLLKANSASLSKCFVAGGYIDGVVGSKHQVPLPARGLLMKSNVE